MKLNTRIIVVFLLAIVAQSCSRKKNTFLSRNYHALTTKYNVIYNGNIALEQGKAAINNQYTENFWEVLPVERMQVDDDFFSTEQNRNENFVRAEDKAVTAIQKHGMNIDGKEKNPQIVEAYLLLGKARYYDQRFVPAIAAFNNILNKYPTSAKINRVKLWREKANIRLHNEEVAIKRLKRLLQYEDLKGQDLADAKAALAQAYINIKSIDSALIELDVAVQHTKIKAERARYHFIRGQLYNTLNKKDSADIAFSAIIAMHRQIPRSYYINAHLQKSYNYDSEKTSLAEFKDYLTDLEENRENRPFLDKIYYRIAEFHRNNTSELNSTKPDSLSEVYYNKSLLKSKSKDKHLTALNYETLGHMYFDKNKYIIAGAYYDSTLTAMVENTKPYRAIKKKRDHLKDVIYYEGIVHVNDSILHMLSLPKDQQLAIYTTYTNELKALEDKKQNALKQEQSEANQKQESEFNLKTSNPIPLRNNSVRGDFNSFNRGSRFYFYNSTAVRYGKKEFLRLWGNRKLQDDWRFLNETAKSTETEDKDTITSVYKEKRFNPNTYIEKLPSEQTAIDSIIKERNYANYKLGIIYKEKFKVYKLAKLRLETLLDNNPEERLILPSKYNLYHIYKLLKAYEKAEQVKADIITNYSDTRYAEILLNPQSELTKDENSPEYIYTTLYKQFLNQEYAEVIDKAETQILRLQDDDFVPKFELLKASAKGRLYGFEMYKKHINFIALNYANSEEGKKAQEIIQNAFPIFEKKEFISNTNSKHFNVVYQFNNDLEEAIARFIETLSEEVGKIKYFDLNISKDVYNTDATFVVVHGLRSIGGANGFEELLKEVNLDEDGKPLPPKITKPYIAVSSVNYAIIQRHKNLDVYLQNKIN